MNKEKLKNIIFSLLNVIVIAGIIVFIIAGLWKIGLVEVPEFIENIFISANHGEKENGKSTEDFLENNKLSDSYEIIKINMDKKTVRQMLSVLVPAQTYSHDFQYTVISNEKSVTKKVTVIEQNGISCAYFVSGDGTAVNKQIIEVNGVTTVNTVTGQTLRTEEYVSGNIDFEEQIGAIITHKDFLEAADNPDYSFSLATGENGMLLLISFTSSIGEYSQTQNYTLNLDYGIVTEAHCYENNNLIYSLTTNSLSGKAETSLNIPRQFSDYLESIAPVSE